MKKLFARFANWPALLGQKRLSVILTRGVYPGTNLSVMQASFFDESWSRDEPMGFGFYPLVGSRLINALSTVNAIFDAVRLARADGFTLVSVESRL